MKANPGKCHVILSSITQREIRFANTSIASSPCEKLLGITLDSELKFEEHINKICNIVNKKLNGLHRIRSHMMFYTRNFNNKINGLHEKALRIVYGNYKPKFDDYWRMVLSVFIIKMFKRWPLK